MRSSRWWLVALLGSGLMLVTATAAGRGDRDMNEHIKVTSSVFPEGGMIPQQYTCDGANLSPPLSLSGLPAGTASLALLVEDPDAPRGTFTHWVAFNLPPVLHEVPERAGAERLIQGG